MDVVVLWCILNKEKWRVNLGVYILRYRPFARLFSVKKFYMLLFLVESDCIHEVACQQRLIYL